MPKTMEQLQAALDREIAYTVKLNEKINELKEQIKNFIPKNEHEKILTQVKRDYELKLSDINKRQSKNYITKMKHESIIKSLKEDYESQMSEINISHANIHNARNAGRKRKVTDDVITRVLELHNQGFAQGKIAKIISNEGSVSISRTLVGDIIRTQNSFSI